MSNEHEKRDNENYAKNFTRVCNIVLDSYKHLTHEEKFLYIKMREVYWDAKPRFATLREISHLTGYAISALSRILPRLDKCGLVHAEIKQEYNPDGTKKGKPKYYITIPDIWELNRKYYECSPEERFDPSVVLLENENVPLKNKNVLQKNENVLLENDVVPPEEHFCGPKASTQARLQTAKDKKDIIKIECKIEGTPTPVQKPESLTHSSTPSSFSSSQERQETPTPKEEQLSPEENRIQGYWCKLGNLKRPSAKKHWATLSEHIKTFEEFEALFKYTQNALKDMPRPRVYPGNLVDHLEGWKQERARLAQPEKPKSPQRMSLAERNRMIEEKYGKPSVAGRK